MNLSEFKNPYCIAGIVIFLIIIATSIYYKFFNNDHFAVEEITLTMNNDLITDITSEMQNIKIEPVKEHIYSNHINDLQNKLNKKEIDIVEAYPYIPLFGVLLYNTADSKLDKGLFNSVIEISL